MTSPSTDLQPRREVPASGGWQRLQAHPKRLERLQMVFSGQAMSRAQVIAIIGPSQTGKSAIALAACDLRRMRPVYATTNTHLKPITPEQGMCVIVDAVSAYNPVDVLALLEACKGICPVILVDRHRLSLKHLADAGAIHQVWELQLPSESAISDYIRELLRGYQHSVSDSDRDDLGAMMHGARLSLAQVNQVTVDAALACLQNGQPIDRPSFDEAFGALRAIQQHQMAADTEDVAA